MFNKLAVVTTPECIKSLNISKKNLIMFCMTCLTVIRLGQITNKKRPSNELTSALKGRIAYIPVDVEANAKFTPDKLLDVNSLSILVAGQPTKAQRVWTSVVNMSKVHAALMWLKEQNPLVQRCADVHTWWSAEHHQCQNARWRHVWAKCKHWDP